MDKAAAFLRFDAVILPPPWPAAVALVVVLGVFWLALQVARRLQSGYGPRGLEVAASFVLVTALVTTVVQALTWLGAATPGVLRIVGGVLGTVSLGLLGPSYRTRARVLTRLAHARFMNATLLERWALCASGVTLLALSLAALGPPTDIDTLAYHLSVPLDWLAHGAATATPDWLHARLVGAGESLNMIGLAMGTDSLGSLFQAAGLLVAVTALTSVATTGADSIFAAAIVASCPLLPFLTLTSKPQLMPAAATSTALALFVWHRRTAFAHLNVGALWLMFGCVSFAVACKYSFIPTGIAVAILVLHALWGTTWLPKAGIVALSTFVAIPLPVYVRNFQFYGDPLSPLLEGVGRDADPVITTFSWYLRNFSGGHSLGHLLRLPWDLVVATNPGQLTNVLGVGALAVLAAPIRKKEDWDILAATASVTLVGLAIGQLGARFFFEPYLWFGLAAVLTSWTLRKRLLFALVSLQMLVTTPVAVYGVITLLPAALNTARHEQVMTRMASDYALSRWLDSVLPKDAVVATDRRSSLFTPRPVLHADLAQMVEMAPLSEKARRARIMAALGSGSANTLVVTSPPESSLFGWLVPELGEPTYVSPSYADAVRNPWNQGSPYTVLVYDLRPVLSRAHRP